MYWVPVAYSVFTAGMFERVAEAQLELTDAVACADSSSYGEYGRAPGIGKLVVAVEGLGVVIVNLVDAIAAVLG